MKSSGQNIKGTRVKSNTVTVRVITMDFIHKCVLPTRVMADSNMIRAVILANNSYCSYKNASLLLTDKTRLPFRLSLTHLTLNLLFMLVGVLVLASHKNADK